MQCITTVVWEILGSKNILWVLLSMKNMVAQKFITMIDS